MIAHFTYHVQADVKPPSRNALLFTDCIFAHGSEEDKFLGP
jgi:hypothetical protein